MNRRSGFTLVEIMIVVAIIGLLAAIALPSFMHARTTAQKNACIQNLAQIEGAEEEWAMENNQGTGNAIVTTALAVYLKGGVFPVCPSGGTYAYNAVGTDPTCTISTHISPN